MRMRSSSFLFRSLYLPHWLYISKFTQLRVVSWRQHGSCVVHPLVFHGPKLVCFSTAGFRSNTETHCRLFLIPLIIQDVAKPSAPASATDAPNCLYTVV